MINAHTDEDGSIHLHLDGESAAAVWATLEVISKDFRKVITTPRERQVENIILGVAEALRIELDERIARCAATDTESQSSPLTSTAL